MKLQLTAATLALVVFASSPIYGHAEAKGLKSTQGNTSSETKYLAFQIFTWSPDPKIAGFQLQGTTLPHKEALLEYIKDIKKRIGTVGDTRTRLAFFLGPLGCFDQGDAEIASFIKLGFELAQETDVAVGFKIDDSMFWQNRKDLWSDPKNVEAMDWEGTPSTGRRLDWGKTPTLAPPQMCFNSKAIQREVHLRSTVLGNAIQAGVTELSQLKKPELFAGVIAGSETMIGQDFKTGRYLGYRALMNRGFSRKNPPQNMDLERESVVKEFIDLWTKGLAAAGVDPQKIYSHTAFLARRVFKPSDKQSISYSEQNHFAPPSVAFGDNHRPGFSTYPQPGLFDQIYEELGSHNQVGWASCEGTNLQLGSGPGQSGMSMETYLAKMFNHGATLVDVFSWGVGGEANKNMDFRVVTEGPDAIQAYRKFLKGVPLAEDGETLTRMERLPADVHRIQTELPAWIQRTGKQSVAEPLMHELEAAIKANDFDKAEAVAESILKLIDDGNPPPAKDGNDDAAQKIRHEFGNSFLVFRDKIQAELKLTADQKEKLNEYLQTVIPDALKLFHRLESLTGEERQREFETARSEALTKLEKPVREILNADQQKRLRELVRQREGLMGGPDIWKDLEVTDDERTQFMDTIHPMQSKIEAAMKAAQNGGNPHEVQTKVLKLRFELEAQLEAVLTPKQQALWKEMLGKPMPVDALFDLSS